MTCKLQQQLLLQLRQQQETSPARRQELSHHSGVQPSLLRHRVPGSKDVACRKKGMGPCMRRPLIPGSSATHAVTNTPATSVIRNQKGASNPRQACSISDCLGHAMHYSSGGSEHNWLWPYA